MSKPNENLICPFCGDGKKLGFDLIGLKDHLQEYCKVWNNTISIDEERRQGLSADKMREAT